MMILVGLSVLAVLVGLGPMPYAYYMLLRIVLCLTAVVGFLQARRVSLDSWAIAFGAVAVLYNPVLPVKLGDKGFWIVVNLVTLGVLVAGERALRGRNVS